ncbi:hypothetical protein BGX26_003074, partial [Mortierella sp. AD094]
TDIVDIITMTRPFDDSSSTKSSKSGSDGQAKERTHWYSKWSKSQGDKNSDSSKHSLFKWHKSHEHMDSDSSTVKAPLAPSTPSRKPVGDVLTNTNTAVSKPPVARAEAGVDDVYLILPSNIFPNNVDPPSVDEQPLPIGERPKSTFQVAYSLHLLRIIGGEKESSTSASPKVASLDAIDASKCQGSSPSSTVAADAADQDDVEVHLSDAEKEWVKSIREHPDEEKWLRSIPERVLEEFIKDEIKNAEIIVEMTYLAPLLKPPQYRRLLNALLDKLGRLLDPDILLGVVQLIRFAPEGVLEADDLIEISQELRQRLKKTRTNTRHLVRALSFVLEAMADDQVEDLDRIEDHVPMKELLQQLKDSSDPFVLFYAAYAFRSLQRIPDDESALKCVSRYAIHTVKLGLAIAGVAKIDLNELQDGLGHLPSLINEVTDAVMDLWEGLRTTAEDGKNVWEYLRNDARRKGSWYVALRATAMLMAEGQLADFKTVVCDPKHRQHSQFQLGVALQLAEMAIDPRWENDSRRQAIDFLAEMYKKDIYWRAHAEVKQMIVSILARLATRDDNLIRRYAEEVLNGLRTDGDEKKRQAFILGESQSKTLILSDRPVPEDSSVLLCRVLDHPTAEDNVRSLKNNRLKLQKQSSNTIYIPLMAKPNYRSNDTPFDLMDHVESFLKSDKKILLLLGDSGSGKSTFAKQLELRLLNDQTSAGPMPLFVLLQALEKPKTDLVEEQLRHNGFKNEHIQQLKERRELLLVCDGYDEAQITYNIFTSNRFNQPGQWHVAKMIICCRRQYLGDDYVSSFHPSPGQRSSSLSSPFQEAFVAPLSEDQIKAYVNRHVDASRDHKAEWSAEEYFKALNEIPRLMELVQNPFLLYLTLEALPTVTQHRPYTSVNINRLAIYDAAMGRWLEKGKLRVEQGTLDTTTERELRFLQGQGFTNGVANYLKQLATAIFEKNGGLPVIKYSPWKDMNSWKAPFFDNDIKSQLFRVAGPLFSTGLECQFIHRSLQEYYFSLAVFDPKFPDDFSLNELQGYPLSHNFVNESSVVHFLSERVQSSEFSELLKKKLRDAIEMSKTSEAVGAAAAAANAMTILVRAGVNFNGEDLQGIRIPGADLSGGQFDSTQLQGAVLSGAIMRGSWLRQANLTNADMDKVDFGELPYIEMDDSPYGLCFSHDGTLLAVANSHGLILYNTSSWKTVDSPISFQRLRGDKLAFSPDDKLLAVGGTDKEEGWTGWSIVLVDVSTLAVARELDGDGGETLCLSFSPTSTDYRVASAVDNSIWIWNARTGKTERKLDGHPDQVLCVAYSPDGKILASGGVDRSVRLWRTYDGSAIHHLPDLGECVTDIIPYLCEDELAFCTESAIHVWNTRSGRKEVLVPPSEDLGGPIALSSIALSPCGRFLASGSDDGAVQLWDSRTGHLMTTYSDLSSTGWVAFSPTDNILASAHVRNFRCGSVRLWIPRSDNTSNFDENRTSRVNHIAYHPNGHHLVSLHWDESLGRWLSESGEPVGMPFDVLLPVEQFSFSPDGTQLILCYSHEVQLRNWKTGHLDHVLQIGGVNTVYISPSGRHVVTGSSTGSYKFWGIKDHVCLDLPDYVSSITFSVDGTSVVFTKGSHVCLWNIDAESLLWKVPFRRDRYSLPVAFSPDSLHVIVAEVHSLSIIGVETGKVLCHHSRRFRDVRIRCVSYAPDNNIFATGGHEGEIRLWDAVSFQCVSFVKTKSSRIIAVEWQPGTKDRRFATLDDSGTVHGWRVVRHDDEWSMQLCWNVNTPELYAGGAILEGVKNLSSANKQMLIQRGDQGISEDASDSDDS